MADTQADDLDQVRADVRLTRAMLDHFRAEFGNSTLEAVLDAERRELDALRRSIPGLARAVMLSAVAPRDVDGTRSHHSGSATGSRVDVPSAAA